MHIRQKVLPQLRSDLRNPISPNASSINFIYIQNSPITENDLRLLFEKYPPLQDGVEVELRKSVEYENSAIYYGEWEKTGNKRHGRGIQVWTDGSRYEGYWKEDKANVKGKLIHSDGDILISMEQNMKEIGKMINRMEKEKKVGLMEPRMKEIIKKVKKVAEVYLNGLMVVYMKENLVIII